MSTTPARFASTLRRACVLALLAIASHAAHATLITFDERPRVPGTGPLGDTWDADPITHEYDALGVRMDGGYLVGGGLGTGQALLGGPAFSISFTGTLPKYVNLNFSSTLPPGQGTVSATSPAGFLGEFGTGGVYWGGPEIGLVETPYHPNSFAHFHSESGISQLDFTSFFSTRQTALIDNLYFDAVPAVPEPGTLALMVAGLGVVGTALRWRRRGG